MLSFQDKICNIHPNLRFCVIFQWKFTLQRFRKWSNCVQFPWRGCDPLNFLSLRRADWASVGHWRQLRLRSKIWNRESIIWQLILTFKINLGLVEIRSLSSSLLDWRHGWFWVWYFLSWDERGGVPTGWWSWCPQRRARRTRNTIQIPSFWT